MRHNKYCDGQNLISNNIASEKPELHLIVLQMRNFFNISNNINDMNKQLISYLK